MSLAAFEALADRHGGALERWPEPARSQAAALVDQDPQAAAILREAAALDGALGAEAAALAAAWAAPAPLPSGLAGRLAADAQREAAAAGPGWLRALLDRLDGLGLDSLGRDVIALLGGVSAAAAAAGLAAGVFLGGTAATASADDAVAVLIADASDLEAEWGLEPAADEAAEEAG